MGTASWPLSARPMCLVPTFCVGRHFFNIMNVITCRLPRCGVLVCRGGMVFSPAASLGHLLLNSKDWVTSRRKRLARAPSTPMSFGYFMASLTSRQAETKEEHEGAESSTGGTFTGLEESVPEVDVTSVPQALRPGVLCGTMRLALSIGDVPLNVNQWRFLLSLIPADDAKKVQRYMREKDRKLALGSILLQRRVASWVMGEGFHDVKISRTEKNKPFVDARFSRLPRWAYNVSHHGQFVVIATEAEGSVGTDVVNLNDRPADGLPSIEYLRHFERQLTTDEWRSLMAIHDETKRFDAFYRIWAMKEAYVKAIGLGLHFPISRLDCSPGPLEGGEGHELLVDGLDTSGDWRIDFFRLAPSYLWCTIIQREADASVAPAAGARPAAAASRSRRPHSSVRQMCRSTYHLVRLEDLLPEERAEDWENLSLPGAPAAGQGQMQGSG